MSKQKAPKAQADSMVWIDQAIRDFGIGGLSVRELIEFLITGLKSTNAAVRTSATKTLVTLKLYVGASEFHSPLSVDYLLTSVTQTSRRSSKTSIPPSSPPSSPNSPRSQPSLLLAPPASLLITQSPLLPLLEAREGRKLPLQPRTTHSTSCSLEWTSTSSFRLPTPTRATMRIGRRGRRRSRVSSPSWKRTSVSSLATFVSFFDVSTRILLTRLTPSRSRSCAQAAHVGQ